MKRFIITENEKNRILGQYKNSLIVETQKFKKLLKSTLGNVRPLVEEYGDNKDDCLYRRKKLEVNTFWNTNQEECIECPDGKSLIYPKGECGDCPDTNEYFVSQFGCEKRCSAIEYFNRKTGECEEIPPGMWYDGEDILNIDENEDIKMYWEIKNQLRIKEGKNSLNPYVKPTDPEELKDWNKINNFIKIFIREDVIKNKSNFNNKSEWQYNKIKAALKQMEGCSDYKKCDPPLM